MPASCAEGLEIQLDNAAIAGELLSLSPGLFPALTKEVLTKTIRSYAGKLFKGNLAALARFLGVNSSVLIKPYIPFNVFIRIIQRLRLSALDFLAEKEAGICPPSDSERTARMDLVSVKKFLSSALKDPSRPSVTEVCAQLGVTTPYGLYRYFSPQCRQLTVRHAQVRRGSSTARYRGDRATILKMMKTALKEEPPPTATAVAKRLGIKSERFLVARFSRLYKKLIKRRKIFLAERWVQIERVLIDGLCEESRPSLNELCRRNKYQSRQPIQRRFPELSCALQARYAEGRRMMLQRAEQELKKALQEESPPTLAEVARRLGNNRHFLWKRFPDLTSRLTALHRDHQKLMIEKRTAIAPDRARRVA